MRNEVTYVVIAIGFLFQGELLIMVKVKKEELYDVDFADQIIDAPPCSVYYGAGDAAFRRLVSFRRLMLVIPNGNNWGSVGLSQGYLHCD